MPEYFTMTRTAKWFASDDWVEIKDTALFKKLNLPIDVVSIFIDEFSVHNDLPFIDLWSSVDGNIYRPAKPPETILLRVYDDEITAFWVKHAGTVDGYSAEYTALSYSKRYSTARVLYHGHGDAFSMGKPFNMTGTLREFVLSELCEEASAPLIIVKRDHSSYLKARRAQIQRINDSARS